MQKILLTTFCITLASCTTPSAPVRAYSNELNCSPRALDKISNAPDITPLNSKELKALQEEIKKAVPSAQQCYQTELDTMNSSISTYKICLVIGTSKEGNLNFIDAEDNTNPMPARLKNCIVEVFSKVDVRKAKNAVITQPINLKPRQL